MKEFYGMKMILQQRCKKKCAMQRLSENKVYPIPTAFKIWPNAMTYPYTQT